MQLLNGKETSVKILEELKLFIENKGLTPCMAVIFIGDNPASEVYVRNKKRACEKCGIKYLEYKFGNNVDEATVMKTIQDINNDKNIHGVIVQLPVADHISVPKILKAIDHKKDVDGFTAYNVGKFVSSKEFEDLPSATPGGIIRLLEAYKIEVKGLDVVVIGRSNIVGKPIANMLINRGSTVTVCNSRTKDLSFYTKNADLIIPAVGIAKFLKADMVKEGVMIIDVGINRDENGKLCGDVDFENVSKKSSYITPVPGGVGPMTIAQLMINVVNAVEKQLENKC